MKKVCLVGFAYAGGQKRQGTRKAFQMLMQDRGVSRLREVHGVEAFSIEPFSGVESAKSEAERYRAFSFDMAVLESAVK